MWGSGLPRREFLHADDLADASYFLMQKYNDREIINVGTGEDLTINDLAALIKKIVGFEGKIEHDTNKPDGTPRKVLDVGKLHAMGWKARISLEEGIRKVYQQFLETSTIAA